MTKREFDEAYDNGYKHGYAAGRSDSDVLDKIRAEIEHTAKNYDRFDDYRRIRGLWIALEIIDKYKGDLEQEPKWIPVSEKLPNPLTYVNATCRSLVDDRENWVIETIYLPIPKEVNKHGYSDWGDIPALNWGEAEVIAWVERIIPQPYKADKGDKE